MSPDTSENTSGRERLLLIDALRGSAIVLMVLYHFCFDLAHFGLVAFDFYHDSFWLHARTLILGSFLLLVGVSLVLAVRKRLDVRRYLQRLAAIVAAALLVSAVTWWQFAERLVFFGVLHFIALASILGLLFVRAGRFNLVAGVALIVIGNYYQFAWFDEPGWRWIGLMTHKPLTVDYVPLLPWFGVVLLGMGVAPALQRLARGLRSSRQPLAWLAAAGRHSLLIYLLHQPLLMGAVALYAKFSQS